MNTEITTKEKELLEEFNKKELKDFIGEDNVPFFEELKLDEYTKSSVLLLIKLAYIKGEKDTLKSII